MNKCFLTFTEINDPSFFGVISNISKHGFCVDTFKYFPPGKEISLVISIHNESYEIKGEVSHITNLDKNLSVFSLSRMGVKIIEAPAEFINSIQYLKYNSRIKSIIGIESKKQGENLFRKSSINSGE